MTATNEELVKEYDKYYRNNPEKWKSYPRYKYMYVEITRAGVRHPENVLDVGCGNGHTLAYLHRRWAKTTGFYGLDLSEVAIELTQKNVPGVKVHQGFVEDYQPDVRFDLILCMGVAEHFRDVTKGLRHMKGLLAEEGVLYLEVPNCLSYSPGEHTFRRTKVGSHQTEWHLSRDEWEVHIANSGLKFRAAKAGRNPAWEFIWVLE